MCCACLGASGGFVADSDLIQSGMEWKAAEKKQVYLYPEDMKGVDPRCQKCGKLCEISKYFFFQLRVLFL